jgi:hypothetical protein
VNTTVPDQPTQTKPKPVTIITMALDASIIFLFYEPEKLDQL